MVNIMKKLFVVAFLALALSQTAFAGVGGTGLRQIERISIIKTKAYGHLSADVMQIKVQGGFTPPEGVACSNVNYIETLKSADPDRALFNLLRDAKTQRRNVLLYITDDPTKAAFPGSCSLVAAEVL